MHRRTLSRSPRLATLFVLAPVKSLRTLRSALAALFAFLLGTASAFSGPFENSRQMIVGLAPDWDSMHGQIWLCERDSATAPWHPAIGPIPVLFGKNGLVWGRGLLGTNEPGPHKTEKDKRAPAGVFAIGKIYTYDPQLPAGADYPFHQVGQWDAWVDDPKLPEYNRFIHVSPKDVPEWFEKQRMRPGDFAYRWLVEIRHNADPPVAGEGSAIFFHIRRGVDRPSAGCTTMAESDLVRVIRWLRADKHPVYALLPKAEYDRKWKAWSLPAPSELK